MTHIVAFIYTQLNANFYYTQFKEKNLTYNQISQNKQIVIQHKIIIIKTIVVFILEQNNLTAFFLL